MKRLLALSGIALLFAAGAHAQSTTIVFPPGKLAVFKAGDNTGVFPINSSKVQPCFVQVFDTVTNNQATPTYSFTIPTNGTDGVWINAHAGSEGGGISRTTSRQFLALEGYTGNILSPTASKPSAAAGVTRGMVTVDSFGNETPIYSDPANWFGLPPGVTQNNPTGIASTDGTNFWGTGNVTGTSSEAAGTLFFNEFVSPTPLELQNYIQAAAEARIIGGTLYVVVPGQGVYNFLDPLNNYVVVPLPFDPTVPNPVSHVVYTNLFLNFGTNQNVANFDMNPQGTIAYGADQTFGICKYVNVNGAWQWAYTFGPTNLGTTAQVAANQGCFGICVDFSSNNPVIYATTMELGTTIPNNSQGNANQNRLIRIVDSSAPDPSVLVAQTLATAPTINESFRGVDFTPDLRPQIDSEPANYATTSGGTAYFTVVADAVTPLNYRWESNGIPLSDIETNATLTLSGVTLAYNGATYQCVVSNSYGVVTSAPPALLTVTASAVAPTITNGVSTIVSFINGTATFTPIFPLGTQPFTYQWYQGTTMLVDDGVKYFGSTANTLTIEGLAAADSGNYYLVVSNAAGHASNLVDMLTVNYHLPAITGGDPSATTTFVGYNASLTAPQTGGSAPITNQWYKGATAGTVTTPLSDVGNITGSQFDTVTFTSSVLTNGGFYKDVVSNPAGSVTSAVAQLTVLNPPALSSVHYNSNQIYVQTFDSLPDPGSNSVNSFNNPVYVGTLSGNVYSLANPFDFAYPVINASFVGGLGLSNTMPGWYGAADTLFAGVGGYTRFGAQDGDQSTGGDIDFGRNDVPGTPATNRALGLLSTSTTGSTTFALKLINTSGNTLNYVSLGFVGEFWRQGTGARQMSFGYTLDNSANTFSLTAQSISNSTLVPGLAFSFPTGDTTVPVDGTAPENQVNLGANNLALSSAWPANGALWLIWSIEFYGSGSGNGYGIDNLYLSASANPAPTPSAPQVSTMITNISTGAHPTNNVTLSFTNTPGALFEVLTATNVTPPIDWQPIGQTAETPLGSYSTYQFTHSHSTNQTRFYKIVSP